MRNKNQLDDLLSQFLEEFHAHEIEFITRHHDMSLIRARSTAFRIALDGVAATPGAVKRIEEQGGFDKFEVCAATLIDQYAAPERQEVASS